MVQLESPAGKLLGFGEFAGDIAGNLLRHGLVAEGADLDIELRGLEIHRLELDSDLGPIGRTCGDLPLESPTVILGSEEKMSCEVSTVMMS